MKKFNIKSIILGIGIGIVMTSFISIIYLAGSSPGANLTNEEVIKAARQLGMIMSQDSVKAEDIIKTENSARDKNIKQKQNDGSNTFSR